MDLWRRLWLKLLDMMARELQIRINCNCMYCTSTAILRPSVHPSLNPNARPAKRLALSWKLAVKKSTTRFQSLAAMEP